jgi:hypothetical protein
VALHVGDELLLDRRHPDADARRGRARQTLHLVAVVMRDEDVGDAVELELREPVEHQAAAEVDEHGLAPVAQDVDVAGVPHDGDAARDGGGAHRTYCREAS